MQYKTYFLFVQILLFCNQCYIHVKALVGHNIRDAADGEFPAIVCIAKISSQNLEPNDIVRCGGTLITQNHVLTAEHCLEMVQVSQYQVIAGSVNLTQGTRRNPLWWMSYDQWAIAMDINIEFERNDIGILKLIETQNFHCNPAVIYTGFNYELAGLYVSIAGWGLTNTGRCSQILKTAYVNIISNELCENIVYALDPQDDVYIHERYLCSIIEPYVLVDSGDSGGPVLIQNVLVAITTGTTPYLNGFFHGGKVNCHTGIEFYKNFIDDSVLM